MQAQQAAQPVDWNNPGPAKRGRRLQGAAVGADAEWLEPSELGDVMAGLASRAAAGHGRDLLGDKTECDFKSLLGILTEQCVWAAPLAGGGGVSITCLWARCKHGAVQRELHTSQAVAAEPGGCSPAVCGAQSASQRMPLRCTTSKHYEFLLD